MKKHFDFELPVNDVNDYNRLYEIDQQLRSKKEKDLHKVQSLIEERVNIINKAINENKKK